MAIYVKMTVISNFVFFSGFQTWFFFRRADFSSISAWNTANNDVTN